MSARKPTRADALEAVAQAAQRIVETFPADYIEQSRQMRKLLRGSGGTWFVSHARMCALFDALDALGATPPRPARRKET